MDCQAFESSPVGSLRRITGHDAYLRKDYDHFAFVPNELPASLPLEPLSYKMASEAEREVGRLDASTKRLPNPKLLVRPALIREAVSTSALEGTYAPLIEVLEADYLEATQRRSEVREILNWIEAAERGIELIAHKPLCVTMFNELQQILVHGTHGDGADAGQLRNGQVFIGQRHDGIERSSYVPPPAGELLIAGVDAWERWINEDHHFPLVVKLALTHYQFETLHPYHDGNGRLGRLIAVLQLITAKAIEYPLLNLSPWLEPRKERYKDLMLQVSMTGDFDPWVQFFAEAVRASALEAVSRVDRLIDFRTHVLDQLKSDRARGVVLDVVDDLISYPLVSISQVAAKNGVTYPPAAGAIERLTRLGFLEEITGRSYGRVFACHQVMQIVNEPAS